MVYYKKFSIFLTFLMFYSSSICLSLSETFKDNGVSTFMYHRFGEDKYPSTNVKLDIFKKQINKNFQFFIYKNSWTHYALWTSSSDVLSARNVIYTQKCNVFL